MRFFLGIRKKLTSESLTHFVVEYDGGPELLVGVLETGSFQETITSLLQGVGCVAEVVNLSSGMTFLSSNPAPPPSSWAHYLASSPEI